MEEKSLEQELGEALREFARPEDCDGSRNLPVFRISDEGKASTSFIRRMEFTPSGTNHVAKAIKAFEDGNPGPLQAINPLLRDVGIEMRLRTSPLDGPRCIIDEIIFGHKGFIHERCGIDL